MPIKINRHGERHVSIDNTFVNVLLLEKGVVTPGFGLDEIVIGYKGVKAENQSKGGGVEGCEGKRGARLQGLVL